MAVKLPDLPVVEVLPALRSALERAGRAVLAAPPGSGKTTVVPLALLEEPWLAGRNIVLLEPRRLAARAAAARMAALLGEKVGARVGYRIRFERRVSDATRIEVITEGLLTRRLQREPDLPGVGLVIFDEFHERSLDVDLALALTLDARAHLNPALRVLVMSATLDAAAVSRLLGDAPVVAGGGRLHPVALHYRPPRPGEPVDAAVARGALEALGQTPGDVLAFLPGVREIREAQRRIAERAPAGVSVHPLYGDLSGAEQDAALLPAGPGRRKVIVSTNLAQTSLTVEGVTAVVDSGYARVARFDLGAGANRLDTERISRAAAEQRAGRAGRLAPGACWRLWSEEQHGRLPAHDTPEILSADLTRFALELAAWGVADPARLALLDAPPPAAWSYAAGLLRELGAVDGAGKVTPHGRELVRLPAAPRLGHLLLLAHGAGCAQTAAWIAALLEARDGGEGTDLEARLERARRAGQPGLLESVRQFLRLLPDGGGSPGEADPGRLVAWAYPERIARRRADAGSPYLCEDGAEARLPPGDALERHEWLAIAHWDPARDRRIRLAAPLVEQELLADHAGRIREGTVVAWDPQAQAVVAEWRRSLGALVLARRDARDAAPEAVRAAMLEGVRRLGLGALPWNDGTRQWQARVLSLRAWRPQEDWPDAGDGALGAALEFWLGPHLDGVLRREHLERLDLAGILDAMLDYPRRRALAELAPTHLQVPSGSRLALAYSTDGAPPVLEVRLQEMFGCGATPTVNGGRTPVRLHLLSPARRPVAVTQDLAGFWARGYADVRKDLRGRYPRHAWPEDPRSAAPTTRARPRRSP